NDTIKLIQSIEHPYPLNTITLHIAIYMFENQTMTRAFIKQQRQLRSEEHTSELQSRFDLVCRLLLEKKNHILREKYDVSKKATAFSGRHQEAGQMKRSLFLHQHQADHHGLGPWLRLVVCNRGGCARR